MARIIGIDLGTTNTALGYVEETGEAGVWAPPEVFAIPQLAKPADVKARRSLPSFLYIPGEGELPAGALDLPWGESPGFMVGEAARERGAEVPARLVSSSKSWLCHGGVDREASILPPHAEEGLAKISPVEAAQRYLEHLRAAWDAAHPEDPLASHTLLLTVPASFDAVARELTVHAARQAGLPEVVLLEEPQAAFYAWLANVGETWREVLRPGDRVLVCDVGGGTSDFSLIEVTDDGAGNLGLERVAVGEHLLLGGDNMDLALAHALHQTLAASGKKLDAGQQRALVLGARRAKEALLSDPSLDSQTVTVLGRGSRLFGNKITAKLTREMLETILIEGFFPACGKDDAPQEERRTGFMELGLPFVADPGITRHLAQFLSRHAGEARMPTHVLFNGGVFESDLLRARLLEVMSEWGTQPAVLEGTDNDLAVARGAAWYGAVREGGGLRIRGGVARSYWIGMEVAMPAVPGLPPPMRALCVVPFGMEEGSEATVPGQTLGLVVGQPAEFRFLSSSTRKDDPAGTVLDEFTWPEHLEETAPITATLEAEDLAPGTLVPVELHAKLTEVGTLELWCASKDDGRTFRLEFDVREQASA
jgi:molecular chaperone DnaK (HSP70)